MNIEFLSNILKLIGKKFFYACLFFLIFIEFNEKLEEFFTINQKYYALLWLFAIIAITDVVIAIIGFLKNWYEYLQLEKYSLNALDKIKLNHKNGIEILYFFK